MKMTIDGAIKELNKWRKDLNYDNGDYCYGDDTTKHSLDVAINTLCKYQKIQEIVTSNELEWGNTSVRANALWDVKKVVEDGNVD